MYIQYAHAPLQLEKVRTCVLCVYARGALVLVHLAKQYFDLVTEQSVLLAMQHANTQWNALGTVEEYVLCAMLMFGKHYLLLAKYVEYLYHLCRG